MKEHFIFEEFVETVRPCSCAEIVIRARAEMQRAETKVSRDGSFENGAEVIFQQRLGDLINCFESGVITTTLPKDLLIYRDLATPLVEEKQLGFDVLNTINKAIEPSTRR